MGQLNLDYDESEKKGVFDPSRVYMAQVMDTRDPLHAGRIKVWIVGSNIPREEYKKWIICKHASAFYGVTPIENNGKFKSPIAYGSISNIPYPTSYVMIFYPKIAGENTEPYWFSCPVQEDFCKSVPGYAGNPPTLEKNPFSVSDIAETFKPLDEGIKAQGLETDLIRGYSTSTDGRSAMPTSYGMSTPLGHTITLDDGFSGKDPSKDWDTDPEGFDLLVGDQPHEQINWNSDMQAPDENTRLYSGIRLRTRSGTQVMIMDSGSIYMITRDGSAWVELSETGNIDCFTKQNISATAEGDINLHASNINIEATGDINISATGKVGIDTSEIHTSATTMNMSGSLICSQIDASKIVSSSFYCGMCNATGSFAGTLEGTAKFAGLSYNYPVATPTPVSQDVEMPNPMLKESEEIDGVNGVIVSRLPQAEPYVGHSFNESIKKYDKLFNNKLHLSAAINLKDSALSNNLSNLASSLGSNINQLTASYTQALTGTASYMNNITIPVSNTSITAPSLSLDTLNIK